MPKNPFDEKFTFKVDVSPFIKEYSPKFVTAPSTAGTMSYTLSEQKVSDAYKYYAAQIKPDAWSNITFAPMTYDDGHISVKDFICAHCDHLPEKVKVHEKHYAHSKLIKFYCHGEVLHITIANEALQQYGMTLASHLAKYNPLFSNTTVASQASELIYKVMFSMQDYTGILELPETNKLKFLMINFPEVTYIVKRKLRDAGTISTTTDRYASVLLKLLAETNRTAAQDYVQEMGPLLGWFSKTAKIATELKLFK